MGSNIYGMKGVATVLCVVLVIIGLWRVSSHANYTNAHVKQDLPYQVANRTYVQTKPIVGTSYLLKTSFIEHQRKLLRKSGYLLTSMGIDWSLAGGSLLGAIRDQTLPMPHDDDLDLHIDIAHREALFEEPFKLLAAQHGLGRLIFMSSTATSANKHGSCIRLVLAGKTEPVLDIFFRRHRQSDDKIVKLDGWDGVNFTDSTVEIFSPVDIFPLRKRRIDDLDVFVPSNADRVLRQQYGPNVFEEVRPRSRYISHHIPFALPCIWQR